MKRLPMNINDNEIRVISPSGTQPSRKSNKRKVFLIATAVAIVAVLLAVILHLAFGETKVEDNVIMQEADSPVVDTPISADSTSIDKGYVEVLDTVVNGKGLTFLFPRNATPVLTIGEEALSDTTSVLVAQAADIRADNGKIAGTFVLNGDLISKGEAKAGFCAIVNDHISIGVADATPMLEQAIENNGYFFRQFPLVVGGQLIENRLKSSSLRKALVEYEGNIGIAMSSDKLTLHQFSELLIDAGVRNAIYLVGSTSPGRYRDISGNRIKFGKDEPVIPQYTSFIVWK